MKTAKSVKLLKCYSTILKIQDGGWLHSKIYDLMSHTDNFFKVLQGSKFVKISSKFSTDKNSHCIILYTCRLELLKFYTYFSMSLERILSRISEVCRLQIDNTAQTHYKNLGQTQHS